MAAMEHCTSIDDGPPSDLDSLRVAEGVQKCAHMMVQRCSANHRNIHGSPFSPQDGLGQGRDKSSQEPSDLVSRKGNEIWCRNPDCPHPECRDVADGRLKSVMAGSSNSCADPHNDPCLVSRGGSQADAGSDIALGEEKPAMRQRRKNSVQLRRNRFSSERDMRLTIDEEPYDDEVLLPNEWDVKEQEVQKYCTPERYSYCSDAMRETRSADWVHDHHLQQKPSPIQRSMSAPTPCAPDVIPHSLQEAATLKSRSPDLVPASDESFAEENFEMKRSSHFAAGCEEGDPASRKLHMEGPVFDARRKQPSVARSVSFCESPADIIEFSSDRSRRSLSSSSLSDDGRRKRERFKSSGYGTGDSSQTGSQFSLRSQCSALSDSVMGDSCQGEEPVEENREPDDEMTEAGSDTTHQADARSDSTSCGETLEINSDVLPRFEELTSTTFSSADTLVDVRNNEHANDSMNRYNGMETSEQTSKQISAGDIRNSEFDPGVQVVQKNEEMVSSEKENVSSKDQNPCVPCLSIFDKDSVEIPLDEGPPSFEEPTAKVKKSSDSSDEDAAASQAKDLLEKFLSGVSESGNNPLVPSPSPRQRDSEGRHHLCTLVLDLLKEGHDPTCCLDILQTACNNSPSPVDMDKVCTHYDFRPLCTSSKEPQLQPRLLAKGAEMAPRVQPSSCQMPYLCHPRAPCKTGALQDPSQIPHLSIFQSYAGTDGGCLAAASAAPRQVHPEGGGSPLAVEDDDLEEEQFQQRLTLCRDLERTARCGSLTCPDHQCAKARHILQEFKDSMMRESPPSVLIIEVLLALRLHSERCDAFKCPVFACSFLPEIDPWELREAVYQIRSELQKPFLRLTDASNLPSRYLQMDPSSQFEKPMKEGEDWIVLFNLKESKDIVVAEMIPHHQVVIKKALLHEGEGQWKVLESLRQLQQQDAAAACAIVHHYWALQTGTSLLLCSKFHPDGTVRELLEARKGGLKFLVALRLLMQVVKGVLTLNNIGIIYLNWSSANVLLENGGHRVKISNFTSCAWLPPNQGRAFASVSADSGDIKQSLPPALVPPELLQHPDQGLSFRADSWGCGCLLYELLEGKEVWHQLRHEDREDMWRKMRERSYRIPLSPKQELKYLFDDCWKLIPQKRRSLTSIQAELWELTMPDNQPSLVCI